MTDFNTFSEIKHTPLRVYNRTVLTSNLLDDFGVETARSYLEKFTQHEKNQIRVMQGYILAVGPKQVRDEVMGGFQPEGFDEVE
jgi:hypothetical protein